MSNKPIIPSAVMERWRALSLLEYLILGPASLGQWIEYVALENKDCRTVWDDYNGEYAWMCSAGACVICFGASERSRLTLAERRQIESDVRAVVRGKKSLQDLNKLMPQRPRASMGWSFAILATSSKSGWVDLSGHDPECKKAFQFIGLANIRWPLEKVVKWVKNELEWDGADSAVVAVLRSQPLTEEMALTFASADRLSAVIKAATSRGYPIGVDLSAKASRPPAPSVAR